MKLICNMTTFIKENKRALGRVHHEEQFCDIILNLDQWFRRCHLKTFLFLSSGQPLCSAERKHLCNFDRRCQQFCKIILNLDQWFSGKRVFKDISYLELWQPFLQSGTICTILVEGITVLCLERSIARFPRFYHQCHSKTHPRA